MLRMGLLTSTAMTAVAMLLSAPPTGTYAQTDMHVASRDPNARFLCNYGHPYLVSGFFSSTFSSHSSGWEHVAVRVTGHGQTVSRIKVIEAQDSQTSNSTFAAGIYSNNASGFPGNWLAYSYGSIGQTCGPVTISIPPTKLKAGKKYWIMETASTYGRNQPTRLYWQVNPNTKRKACVQAHTSYYTTPWQCYSSGPYLTLK